MADINFDKVVAGAAGGALGGAIAAISQPIKPLQLITAIIGGIGFGAFTPPLLMDYYATMPPMLCGTIGFFCGLSVFGLIAIVQKTTMKLAEKHAEKIINVNNKNVESVENTVENKKQSPGEP